MIRDPKFDDIRPYYSEEIPQAMERIAGSEFFPLLASYVFPGEDVAAVGRMVGSIGTSEDFQRMVMLPMCGQVRALRTWIGILATFLFPTIGI